MALPKKDKKYKIKLPVCKYCKAIGKHYSYMCKDNPSNHCKYCNGTNHTSLMCQLKPRKPLKQESEKTKSKRVATSRLWFNLNPPNPKGLWFCYLQISVQCPRYLTRSTIRLEHVRSKVRYPELRYEVTNIRPACDFCNLKKQSLDITDLISEFPHLEPYLDM